ncbi:uncharacterized protein LOC125302447 [Alosa alosa]|uniref:uncharacterized protein LOC125302447 n=1 Tax=Alosa alosa TaxID=278164 RepID=UPI002015519A|nr:uncharacterized protein LOC125302447 [Alosa alosa]
MAVFHGQWSEEKVKRLISFYSGHEYLWNPRAELYKNRDIKKKALQELCQQLTDELTVINEEDVKKKFKNLRTVFTREHSMVLKSNKFGTAADEVYVPKWRYYQVLSFLCDACNFDESSDILDSSMSPELVVPTTSQTPENMAPLHPTSSCPHDHMSDSKKQKIEKRQKIDNASEAMDFVLGVLKRKASSPHAGFLHYVENILDDLPESKARKLKRQIIELAHTALDEE